MILSLILAYGNNQGKINDILSTYELPELSDHTAQMYFQRAKTYPPWAKDSLKDLVSYFRNDKHVPGEELLAALRVVSSLQLRCIVNSEIILGNKLEGAPELLSFKELETYKFFFFDITAWSYPDWQDYKKELNPYERTALKYALGGNVHDLLFALQIIPPTQSDEMLKDEMTFAYKEYMRVKEKINENTPPDQRKELLQELKLLADITANLHRSRKAGKTSVEISGGEKKDSMPKFRMILINPDGTIAVKKTREELENDMKKRLEDDERRYKELADKAAAQGKLNSGPATS